VTGFLQFVALGFGLGAIYSLVASGVVLIYQTSGIINFAAGAFALGGAAIYFESTRAGLPAGLALAVTAVGGALFGLATSAVMYRLRTSAPITRVIATLGLLIVFESAGAIRYGATITLTNTLLPRKNWTVFGIALQSDRIYLLLIAAAIAAGLALAQQRTVYGLATRAVAQNELALSALGWSPTLLAITSWVVGGTLAAVAGALILPISGLIVVNLVLLILPALAAALVGRLNSFGLTFVGALGVGITQSLLARYSTQIGVGDAVPFLAIIALVVLTGRALPLRSHVAERLPTIGRGIVRPGVVLILTGGLLYLFTGVFNANWLAAFTASICAAILMLSVVVLTGYAGQISLAQYALAGLGAYVAGRLVAAEGWPYWAAFLAGVATAVPFGVIFAIPAVRTRGVTLAVVTLGLGVAVYAVLFSNSAYTGGFDGTNVGFAKLFGWDIDTVRHPNRYASVVLVLLILSGLGVANLRRSGVGRRLIAIRENERAAASLGIWVAGMKLYAFAIASLLAAAAGIAIAFSANYVLYNESYDPLSSVYALGFTIIGGLGFIPGAFMGSLLTAGGIGTLFNDLLSGIRGYIPLIGGIALIITLLSYPDGFVPAHLRAFAHIGKMLGWKRPPEADGSRSSFPLRILRWLFVEHRTKVDLDVNELEHVTPVSLTVERMTVRFGGTIAVNDVSLSVEPGKVVGLIGPNGAGKTTLIDAVSGFVSGSGEVALNGRPIDRMPPHRRVGAGISRSWQSLELFEDATVLENLQLASESRTLHWWQGVLALFWPRQAPLTPATRSAISVFDLEHDLHRNPGELSYGRRRLLGIARAVAFGPSILMLDEPAAGLSAVESKELATLIRELAQSWGMGILLVEHDVDLVMSVCDHIVVLDFGMQIAAGMPREIARDPAVVRAYLGASETETPAPDEVLRTTSPAL
jgi:sulfate-transporting ATPase